LLQRGHRLPFDLGSLNGIAATERRSVIVEDTETNPLHRANPLLPDTRSEMAVPLLVGDRVVGVLDMQSSQPGALNSENQAAFEALAGSLAIAVANAGLFEEAEAARSKVEEQTRRMTRSGWDDFLDAIERKDRLAYTYNRGNISPLSEPLPETQDETTLVMPLQVSGATVGNLHFTRNETWTEDDFAISNAVAHQVAQQIENLRLLAQSEQYQAEAQEALRRLTREGWEEFQNQFATSHGFVYRDNVIKPLSESDKNFDESLSYEIKVRDEAIGKLSVAGLANLSEEDDELVAAVNEQLSAHLENLRLTQQTQAALSQTEILYNIGRRLNTATNASEILTAVNASATMFGCTQSSLMYIDQDSDGKPEWLTMVAAWSKEKSGSSPVGLRFPGKNYPLTSTLLKSPDNPIFISDIANAENVDDGLRGRWLSAGFRAIVILPLGQAGQWHGLLTFGWDAPHEFSEQEHTIFEGLISLVTPVVQGNQLFTQVQTRAQREQALRRITEAVRSSTDPATIMRTAVRELGTALGRQTQIRLSRSAEQLADPATNKEQA
jgi:GAF domain-containing protein